MRIISLGTKLTIAFVLLGLLPLVMLGIVAQYYITYTHRQDVAMMETQLLKQQSAEINRFLEDTAGLFDVHVGYTQFLSISAADQESLLEDLLTENKNIIEASLIDASGKETFKLSQVQDASGINKQDVSRLPYFQRAKTGKLYFGPLQYTESGTLMTIAGPVTNKSGEVVMVISGIINLDPLVRTISRAGLGQTNYVYVIDASGTIFASANPSLQGKNIGDWQWTKGLLAGQQHDGLLGDDQRPGVLGETVLAAGLPLNNFKWALVAEWPKADAFQIVKDIQYQVLLFSTIAILLAAFLGWLAGRRILSPLRILQAGATRIGQGHFEYKIDIPTHDELEELGLVFNRMGDDLKRLQELKAIEIREKALAESLRKEQEVSRIKEQLIKNTSHQLRTPMSIARWNFDLLKKTTKIEEEAQLKQDLGAGLEQLGAIIRDLITVSDLGFDYKNALKMPVDLPTVFKQLHDKRLQIITEKHLVWNCTSKANMPVLLGNSLYLISVFENLVDNAVTYTPQNGTIDIDLNADETQAHIRITDTGIGIPDKDKDLLFTQFFRATNAIDMKNVGTGLGLYICKTIITGHGGTISLESTLGKGTTVTVHLPLKPPVA